jgi:hypothetical protein
MTPEGKLKEEVKGYLRSIDGHFFMPLPTSWGANAVDFICCVRGRYVAIETKIGPRRPTPRQLAFLKKVRDAGGIGFVAYDIDTVYANLKGLVT